MPAEEEAKSLWRIEDVLDAARNMPLDNVKHLLKRQIDFNMAISKEGLTNDYGASIGKFCCVAIRTACVSAHVPALLQAVTRV